MANRYKKTAHLTESIISWAKQAAYHQLEPDLVAQLKRHLLDSLGSMIHATGKPTVQKLVKTLHFLQPDGALKVPLLGSTSLDRAAQLYTALNRYPDFMDNFLGKHATCHPSDNIGGLLAAGHYLRISGRDLLTVMAIAYQLQCSLTEQMPLMKEGIDHTALLAVSLTAALSRLFSLTEEQAAHAIGIAAASLNATVTSRAVYTYEWKGFASSLTALNCMNIVLLAKEGMTGPLGFYEGPMGLEEVFHLKPQLSLEYGRFDLISQCILKSHNAEVHTQPAIEAVLELRRQHRINYRMIKAVEITTFLTAYHITGGGKYGNRHHVQNKEQADHSMPYVIAVALIDGQVMPEQFLPERIRSADVQELLQKINVGTELPLHTPRTVTSVLDPYTSVYPRKVKTKVTVVLKNNRRYTLKKDDYEGFYTRPLDWDQTCVKFRRLTDDALAPSRQQRIISLVSNIEKDSLLPLMEELTGIGHTEKLRVLNMDH